jgi:hypothetical protein
MVEDRELLAHYLEMDDDDLLADIAIASDPEAALHSPDALLAKGRAVVAELRPQLRKLICPYARVLEGPEIELGLAISGFLVGGVPGALVQPLAAYVVKRGLRVLCADVAAAP